LQSYCAVVLSVFEREYSLWVFKHALRTIALNIGIVLYLWVIVNVLLTFFTERLHLRCFHIIFQHGYVDILPFLALVRQGFQPSKREWVGVIYLLPSKSVTNVQRRVLGAITR
jgi:hypothetical protein